MAKILSEFGIEGYSFGEGGGDAGSRAAALQAFAGFRGAVRDHAKSGLASSSEPKDALKNILQAADRCPACLTTACSNHQRLSASVQKTCSPCSQEASLAALCAPLQQGKVSVAVADPTWCIDRCIASAEFGTRICQTWAFGWRTVLTGASSSRRCLLTSSRR